MKSKIRTKRKISFTKASELEIQSLLTEFRSSIIDPTQSPSPPQIMAAGGERDGWGKEKRLEALSVYSLARLGTTVEVKES